METVLLILAGIFAVVMVILLPKYAKFIHNQPKIHMEKMRQKQGDEEHGAKNHEDHQQD